MKKNKLCLMKLECVFSVIFYFWITTIYAQIGIGTATPNGVLDISSSTNGIVIPNVALTSRSTSTPIVNPNGGGVPIAGTLVWNTATTGVSPNNVVPGFYYWNGSAWNSIAGDGGKNWSTTGNSGSIGGNITTAGTNFIGTTDAQNLDIRTNNNVVGRFSALGEFFIGTLNTTLTGDLSNAVSNTTFPWALNGYSSNNGSGVYGQITSGNSIFGGVQGEYNGTGVGTGTRGVFLSTTAGTGFSNCASGVQGTATASGTYKFGVYGSGGTTARSGGVFGYDGGLAMGALGYYSNSGIDYSVYGFSQSHTTGSGTGKISNSSSLEKNTNIGLGIYGGVMGGWVRGMKYGFHTKGETYSLYIDGNGYTNKPLAFLINTNDQKKVVSFMNTSLHPEVSLNGKTNLNNGKIFIAFEKSFSQIISNIDDVIITATPQGKSNGVYIDNITKEGFWIYENNNGISNVKISWIAITKIKGEENPIVPSDLLSNDFDTKMNNVMFNDSTTTDASQSIWWDGTKIRWDKPINEKVDTQTKLIERPKN